MSDLGLSGHLARTFIESKLTPLLLAAALAAGLVALFSLAREEEPQISVPMVDLLVNVDGYKAVDAAELVTKPLEDIVKGTDGVEHVYSQTMDDRVVVTARFNVGTDEDVATLRIHEQVRAHMAEIPLGIPEPLIIGRGINHVAVLVLTLTAKPGAEERWNDNTLLSVADELRHELIKSKDVGLTYIVGGRKDQIRVEPDPEALSRLGVTLNQLVDKIANANRSFLVGRVEGADKSHPVSAGQTLMGVPDVGQLLITTHDNRPVYVKDVADVVVGPEPSAHRTWHLGKGDDKPRPAVSLAIAKRKGANAVLVASDLLKRVETLKGPLLPPDVDVHVTRNYGHTAAEKADELLLHLGIATVSIVALIALTLGMRAGIVVMMVVPTTILLTLFASWLMGYTINRVSLFALIFSIGILVDDAIVVVENIVRHRHLEPKEDPVKSAIRAVAEVGNPTIIATLTIVAALLPMMFVSGLMGPYMSPIPANASAAMLFSFFIAVTVTPWLLIRLTRQDKESKAAHDHEGKLGRMYRHFAEPLIRDRAKSKRFLLITAGATLAVCLLFVTKTVTVKLLPFDNKSEVQVVADLPEGATLEATERVLFLAAMKLRDLPELVSIQTYAGTAAPFNFNGLVRHSYLRDAPELGDLQINLQPKSERSRPSHDIALDIRARLKSLDLPAGTSLKVVEVPPGPPVLATLLAEIYAKDADTRRQIADKVTTAFKAVDFIADVDNSFGTPAQRYRISIDQDNLEFHGVEEKALYDTLRALLGGVRVGYSQRGFGANPIEIAIRLPREGLSIDERLLATPIPTRSGKVVELGDVVTVSKEASSFPIYRRDGHFAEMVTGELAGRFEAPIYGMFAVEEVLDSIDWGTLGKPLIAYHGP
ncbi:MAG: efflux RND transporter permease subunit, partial [Alphaproteobacteria bacterium]|nr:efflux RND transporter permease subunit [Alphaproteobacteria bacterium]